MSCIREHGVAGLFIDPESIISTQLPKKSRISPRKDTALFKAHFAKQTFETIAKSLAEGVGISSTTRIQSVNKQTVLLVLRKAGEHVIKVSNLLLRNVKTYECQLDEMWSFVGKKEKNLNAMEKLSAILGDNWIWIAFDAINKIVLTYVNGKRTLPHAVSLIENVKAVTLCMPSLFSSDQLAHYANAILQVYGNVCKPLRKGNVGRLPNPVLVPPDDLLYVQVVKQYKKNRLEKITNKVIFGDTEKVKEILADSPISNKINTSYVERNNGTIRHMNARCARKTYRFSKIKRNHELQLALTLAYYHLCCPHKTLTNRNDKLTTPFMSAGLTNHVWNMEELLAFKTD